MIQWIIKDKFKLNSNKYKILILIHRNKELNFCQTTILTKVHFYHIKFLNSNKY